MKVIKRIFVILVALIMSFSVVACGEKETKPVAPVVEKKITLNYTEKELIFGDSLSLIATYEREEGKTLTWASSNNQVATVNSVGDVESVSIGQAKITATYGDLSASCDINVSFGSLYPSLIVENTVSDFIKLNINSEYNISGYVSFNGKAYRDVTLSISSLDENVVKFENNKLKAMGVGNTSVVVSTSWMGFTGATLTKEIAVEVSDNLVINTYASVGELKEIANKINLSLVDSWQGKDYNNSAVLETKAYRDSQDVVITSVDYTLKDETNVISIIDNNIYAENIGTCDIIATSVIEGNEYTNEIKVVVDCPMENYNGQLEIETIRDFDVDNIFGKGAVILSAKQGNKVLQVKAGKKIEGIVAEGENTEKLTICSSLGGYEFNNIYAYTKKITSADEFKDIFTLTQGKVIEGYYILANDITVDMTTQKDCLYIRGSSTNRYFCGTFDGKLNKISATVGVNGLFGGIGNGATIKDTEFEFSFVPDAIEKNACGLAKNGGAVFMGTGSTDSVILQNLKVTTTNFFDGSNGTDDRSASLMGYMNYKLLMKDIYVNILGANVEYTKSTQKVGALFNVDCNSLCASCENMYKGGWSNIRVVTGVFMPMANGQYGGVGKDLSYYATYAITDYSDSATTQLKIVGEHSGSSDYASYCKIFANTNTTEEQKDLLGSIYFINTGKVENQVYAWVYLSTSTNGGVYRYDTVQDLKDAGIKAVGSWTI